MGYITRNLRPGERVVATTGLHAWRYAMPVGLAVGGAALVLAAAHAVPALIPVGAACMVVGGLFGLKAEIDGAVTELAVTDQRVIAKTGLFRRDVTAIDHRHVAAVNVSRGSLGRALGFGTITILDAEGTFDFWFDIRDPLAFCAAAMEQIERARPRPPQHQIGATVPCRH
jgi:membrane protein YdbS with pleckstrin-like domain